MVTISMLISNLVKSVAELGAGFASAGFCYEAKMPRSLMK